MSHPILRCSINGKAHQLSVDPDTPLLTVLRDVVGLTGTRFGCGQERCGACTVLVDERSLHACKLPMAQVAGRAITTIEGLGTETEPGPIQRLFMEEQAAQCGYCINGIIMTLTSLLQRRPLPSRDEVLHHVDERHLCRCGAHPRILRVIDRALAAAQAETAAQGAAT